MGRAHLAKRKQTLWRMYLALLPMAAGASALHDAHAQDIKIRARGHAIETRAAIHAKTWKNIPIFVRAGSILATQALQQYVGQQPGNGNRA
jgi:hypothetical protein